jgi:hypothetical protein
VSSLTDCNYLTLARVAQSDHVVPCITYPFLPTIVYYLLDVFHLFAHKWGKTERRKFLSSDQSHPIWIGTIITFFQSHGIVPLLIVMSSNRVRYGIMASPPIFSLGPGTPSDLTDLFLQVIANRFLIMLILMVQCLSERVEFTSGISRSLLKTEA